MAEAVATSVAPPAQVENTVDKAEQYASQLKTAQPQRQMGSSVQTPEITGGDDAGGHISDDAGNEVAKGESAAVKAVHQQNFYASDTMSTQEGNVMARTGSTPPPDATEKAGGDGGEGRQHHLLRHSLPTEQRGTSVLSHFGVETVSDAAKSIKKMSQRDLQAKFKAVYGTKTFSNNNNWLRRKLFEAIGMDPGKSATKKASAGGPRRRRTTSTVKSTSATATRRIKPPLRYARRTKAELEEEQHSVAEALLALADTSETPLLKETRRVQQTIQSDGIVPGRDDVSELSWSSRGRDVPAVKEEPALHQSTQLPTAPPLMENAQEAMMSSMMEYFTMMQRMMMHQSPENQHAIMSMFSGQQSPTQQAQFLQQMQQLQQIQQMQMLMAMQSNPSMVQAMQQSYSHPHTEYVKTLQDAIAAQTGGSHPFASAQSGSLQGSYPDIFTSPKTE
ncbi:hypothetical protein M9435_006354 [Picochlorum sp. BPE23]|nr:hypothetical protein M9435_006354 [Picochlorum sp. BPE23]